MKQGQFIIERNESLNSVFHTMTLRGDTSGMTAPGQFINISLPGFFLRRPMSVYDWDEDRLMIVYKTVGRGTEAMSRLSPGAALDVLTGLGNGFLLETTSRRPALLGGGSGCAPMYALAKWLTDAGVRPQVILGFNTAAEVYGLKEFEALGCETYVTTVDGLLGTNGFVTDVLKTLDYDYFYTCGPMPMYRAIEQTARTGGQYSLEERMGCGFGACMGCTIMTVSGPRRVCHDGPVFRREELIWPTRR